MQISQNKIKDLEKFSLLFAKKQPQILFTELNADLHTIISVALKLEKHYPQSIILESVEKGERKGRYSLIAFDFDKTFEVEKISAKTKISQIKDFVNSAKFTIPDELPSIATGVYGYFGFDAVNLSEKITNFIQRDEIGVPLIRLVRPTVSIVFDHLKEKIFISAINYNEKTNDSFEQLYEKISTITKVINESEHFPTELNSQISNTQTNFNQSQFAKIVAKAKKYIIEGDIFQVVLSRRIVGDFSGKVIDFYRKLRRINPSPYLFLLKFADFSLVGSSPEILVGLKGSKLTLRPIAGTRKRGKNEQEDAMLAKDLLKDEKEIAEHLMLLDLGRNDLSKIAKKNSVKVLDKMFIEKYSHVMHMVSNIEAEIDEKYDAVDAIFATFPAGTVSGAPKIRAIEIINELENVNRSFYAGIVAYFSSNGDMVSAITLRTALIKGKKIYIQAGGGNVYDSIAEKEFEETENKMKALFG